MKTFAEYYFGFGVVKIKKPINLNNLSIEDVSIIMHEYIHFIQDYTTTFGLRHCNFILQKVIATINHASKDYNPETLNYFDYTNASELNTFYELTYGHDKDKLFINYNTVEIKSCTIELDDEETELYELLLGELSDTRAPKLLLEVNQDGNKMEIDTTLSAIDLMECYAYLVEKNIYDSSIEKILQYELAKEIASFINPYIANSNLYLASVCDASLMYENPGLIYYCMLSMMNKEKFNPSSVEEIYEYFDKRIKPNYKKTIQRDIDELLNTINDLYNANDNEFHSLNRAYNDQIKILNDFMTNRSYFTTNLLELKGDELIQFTQNLLQSTTTPIIITNNSQPSSSYIHDNQSITITLATMEFFKLFNCSSEKYCSLYGICSNSNNPLISKECINNPLHKSANENLCPLKLITYKWSLI